MTIEPKMLWLAWVMVGAIAGLVLYIVLPGSYRLIFDIAAGALGGFLGGMLVAVTGAVGAAHFGLLSMATAVGGAIVSWGILHWSRLSYKQNSTPQP